MKWIYDDDDDDIGDKVRKESNFLCIRRSYLNSARKFNQAKE